MNIFGRFRSKKAVIYLDYASLTPIDKRVVSVIKKYSSIKYSNPSSIHNSGVQARKALNEGRKKVADFLNAHPDEIIFTSGGTEANGLALEGAGRAAFRKGIAGTGGRPHLIISSIEHSSVLEIANMMENNGCEVTRLSVDKFGRINLDELKKSIKPNTFMVSVMMVNNETGVVEPLREVAKIVRNFRSNNLNREESLQKYPLLHTDASQASLYFDLNVEKLGVDLVTLDGSKVYGPRGIGCLYIKRATPIEPIIYGGGQEKGLRSGTENIPSIMGFAKALEIAKKERDNESARIQDLKNYFWTELVKLDKGIVLNSPGEIELVTPHILNVSIPNIDNEFFVLQLDARGVECSTKSSCLRDEEESYVLKALGSDSKTSVRFSFGRFTRFRQLKKVVREIRRIL